MDDEVTDFIDRMMHVQETSKNMQLVLRSDKMRHISSILPEEYRTPHNQQMENAAFLLGLQNDIITALTEQTLKLSDALDEIMVKLNDHNSQEDPTV